MNLVGAKCIYLHIYIYINVHHDVQYVNVNVEFFPLIIKSIFGVFSPNISGPVIILDGDLVLYCTSSIHYFFILFFFFFRV